MPSGTSLQAAPTARRVLPVPPSHSPCPSSLAKGRGRATPGRRFPFTHASAGPLARCRGCELELCLQTVKQHPPRCLPTRPAPPLTPPLTPSTAPWCGWICAALTGHAGPRILPLPANPHRDCPTCPFCPSSPLMELRGMWGAPQQAGGPLPPSLHPCNKDLLPVLRAESREHTFAIRPENNNDLCFPR